MGGAREWDRRKGRAVPRNSTRGRDQWLGAGETGAEGSGALGKGKGGEGRGQRSEALGNGTEGGGGGGGGRGGRGGEG